MSEAPSSQAQSAPFTVAELFAEREAKQQTDKKAEEQMSRRQEEELADFKRRLDNMKITPETVAGVEQRIRRAFDRGETEIMLASFPCSFCTDEGRAVNNADLPPLIKPSKEEAERMRNAPPAWLDTLPKGARLAYDYWKTHMQSAGFRFAARIIDYPDGKPGHVGLFISWPKSLHEEEG